jgi:hypothetical protein
MGRSKVWKNKDGMVEYWNTYGQFNNKPNVYYYNQEKKKFYTRDDKTKEYVEVTDKTITATSLKKQNYRRVPMRDHLGRVIEIWT